MAHCNNRCVFCLARDEMSQAEDIPLETLKRRIGNSPNDEIVDFFGGEPTLYPHFMEALTYAREKGHPCTIATNGRRFSDARFTHKIADLGIKQIRTSIYGHTAALHDFHTSCRGSYQQTMRGIQNILQEGIELFVNIVITSANFDHLNDTVATLHKSGVQNVKFASLTNADICPHLIPEFSRVRPELQKAMRYCRQNGLTFSVEKTPLCLLGNEYKACVYEPDPIVYQKTEACYPCQAFEYCVGAPIEQFERFGSEFIQPFQAPKYTRAQFEQDVIAPENVEFVKWTDELPTALTIIVKTTGRCNLACHYCYAAPYFTGPKIIGQQLLKEVFIDLANSSYDRVDINWHGGEPLVAGLDFFEWVVQEEARAKLFEGRTIVNRLQTNGTLIDQKAVNFIKGTNIEVGVSLDGPRDVHDIHRVYIDGRSSFQDVLDGIEQLATNDIPVVALAVITPEMADRALDVFDFFLKLGSQLHCVDFLPSFEVYPQTHQPTLTTITPQQYSDFMITMFDLWFNNDMSELNISFFEDVLLVLLGGNASLCNLKRGCRGFVTIMPNGDVYPCDRFAGLSEFCLGNITDTRLASILSSPTYAQMQARFDAISDQCWQCEWLRLCRGGCSYEAFAIHGVLNAESFFCQARKDIFAHIDGILAKDVDGYRRFYPLS